MKKLALFILIFPYTISAQCWQSIAAGGNFTTAQKIDGTLWAWGGNDYNQLGDGTNTEKHEPVSLGSDINWQSISGGSASVIAIKMDGTLWGWGNTGISEILLSIPTQIGIENDWLSVSSNSFHTLAIKTDGTLWAGGNNNYGQLGDGTNTYSYNLIQIGTDADWLSVSTGFSHSLAIKTNGTLWACGRNNYGQLGDYSNNNRSIPVQIGADTDWQSVSSHFGEHSLAIKTNGTLWGWGRNSYGEVGDGTTIDRNHPVQIGTDNQWQYISGGGTHSLGLKTDGTLWAWGENNLFGQLGGFYPNQVNPKQIGSDTNWVSISAGGSHTTAIKSDHTLWVCGWNINGQLGNGTNTGNIPNRNAQWLPIPVSCLPLASETFSNENPITLFPNPTKDYINISNPTNQILERITVTDVTGKTILVSEDNSNLIDVRVLQIGLYFMKMEFEGKTYQQKFIKQ